MILVRYLVGLADRHWKHSRDTVVGDFGGRVLQHIPIGILIGATFPLSIPILVLFIRYEENEDVHTYDQAWKDYYGTLVGAVVGLLLEVLLLWWIVAV